MRNMSFLMIVLLVMNFGCKTKVHETTISQQKLGYDFLIKNSPTLVFTTGHDLNNKSALAGVTLKMIDSTTISYNYTVNNWKNLNDWLGVAKLEEIENDSILDIYKNIIPVFEFQDKEKNIIIKVSKNTKLNESMAQIFKNKSGKIVEFSPLLYYK